MRDSNQLKYYLDKGLRIDYLGDWYIPDHKFDYNWNLLRRLVEIHSTVDDFIRLVKSYPHNKIDAKILLEFEHLGAIFHNESAKIYKTIGLRHVPESIDKINMDYITKKYGAILK